jgi:hypothetical protein
VLGHELLVVPLRGRAAGVKAQQQVSQTGRVIGLQQSAQQHIQQQLCTCVRGGDCRLLPLCVQMQSQTQAGRVVDRSLKVQRRPALGLQRYEGRRRLTQPMHPTMRGCGMTEQLNCVACGAAGTGRGLEELECC